MESYFKNIHFCIKNNYEQAKTKEINFELYACINCHDFISLCIVHWPKDWPDISDGIFPLHDGNVCFYETIAIFSEEPFLTSIDENVTLFIIAQSPGTAFISASQRDGGSLSINLNEKYIDCIKAAKMHAKSRKRTTCEVL